MTLIAQLPANVHVEHKGVVDSEQVGAQMSRYHLMYLPSQGENFGHVILESLMAGRPVLISDQTPWRGLADKHAGWDLPLDDITQFAKQIDLVAAMDQQQYDRWSYGAAQLAREFIDDKAILNDYRRMLGGNDSTRGATDR